MPSAETQSRSADYTSISFPTMTLQSLMLSIPEATLLKFQVGKPCVSTTCPSYLNAHGHRLHAWDNEYQEQLPDSGNVLISSWTEGHISEAIRTSFSTSTLRAYAAASAASCKINPCSSFRSGRGTLHKSKTWMKQTIIKSSPSLHIFWYRQR